MPDRIQQYFIIAWLSQEFLSSAFHCFHRHGYIAMAGEKGNRHVTAFGSEALLEFETIQIRRRYIKDETARNSGSRTGEEFVCGCERLRLTTSGADQQLDPTHTKVSINTFVQYTRFFSYGLIATVIPSEVT